ncbi:MAG: HAMP domain-containing histidine kinase [Oscillospiraceae bacterium]|nr:HAMP domain-containing histidine kinase [Oscillospiraceae bacterium]
MNLFRSPEARTPFLLQLCTAASGAVICLFFSVPAAFVLIGVSVIMLFIQGIYLSRHRKRISKLCDDIDEILRGADRVLFDEFREGELGILSSEIHKMTVRLREQNSALRQDKQFMKEALEDMSHQLRTPLTTMMLILGMLREPDLTKQQRTEYVRELYGLLSGMQWKLETLLNMSRLEAGAVTLRRETIHMSELIKAALEPLSISIELKNVTVDTEIEDDPIFSGDRQYCTEALVNILKNCLEHIPEGGSIAIRAYENSIFTGLSITDTGDGIDKQDIPHIFERFYRGSGFSKNGYGIGLAFAHKIITSQNGSLQVRNIQPHGAEFDLRIYKTVV